MQQQKTQVDKPTWSLFYSTDENGKDTLIMEGKTPVVMEWERPYVYACVDATKPKGDVLEVGFGLGFAAEEIQKFNPQSHIIVEDIVPVLSHAKDWAKNKKGVKVIERTWESTLDNLGLFDTIIFDDHVRITEQDIPALENASNKMQKIHTEFESLTKQVTELLKNFKGQKFTDKDLHSFEEHLLKIKPSLKMVEDFLQTLVDSKAISAQQKDKLLQAYAKVAPKETPQIMMNSFINFAEVCLNKHMKKGAKMSAFIVNPNFKNTNKEFHKRIISRPDVSYSEMTMPVSVPKNCKYYSDDKALVIVIEKK